jgi:hypothetical protein
MECLDDSVNLRLRKQRRILFRAEVKVQFPVSGIKTAYFDDLLYAWLADLNAPNVF